MRLVKKLKTRRQSHFDKSTADWRIQLVSFENSKQTGVVSVLPAFGALGSVFGFVAAGLGIVFPMNGMPLYAGSSLAVFGLAVMFGGLWLCAKKEKKGLDNCCQPLY